MAENVSEKIYIKEEVDMESVHSDDVNFEGVEPKLEPKVENVTLNELLRVDQLHKSIEVLNENEDGKQEKVYKCKGCKFSTTTYRLWRNHRDNNSHKEIVRSICNVCGKCIRRDNLPKHMSTHTQMPVSCDICGKVAKSRYALLAHMFIHKDSPMLQCLVCGKSYKHKQGYNAHLKRHQRGDVKTEECLTCGTFFYDKQTLIKHIRTHTGEKPYSCNFCGKEFTNTYTLKTHTRRHTNEKPFACGDCDLAFTQRGALKKHFKSKHPNKILENYKI